MRLAVDVDLPTPADDCVAIAAAIVVVSSDGGVWLDGGQPVDARALRAQLEALDPGHVSHATDDQPDDRILVRAGRVDWTGRSIDLDCDVSHLRLRGRAVVESTAEGGAKVRLNGRASPTKATLRLALFMAAPFARLAVRRVVRRHKAEWAAEAARWPRMSDVWHQASEWVFEPTRT